MKKILFPLIVTSIATPLVSMVSCSNNKTYELEWDINMKQYFIENLTIKPHETVVFKIHIEQIPGIGSAVHFWDESEMASESNGISNADFTKENTSISIKSGRKTKSYEFIGVQGIKPNYSYKIIDYVPQVEDIIYITYKCDINRNNRGLWLTTK